MGINLVLGGGGAKGFVHIGVLRELTDLGCEISAIVGTSIGALVGALFAYHSSIVTQPGDPLTRQRRAAAAVETVFLDTDFQAFRDINWWSLLRRGLLKGVAIEEWLRRQMFITAAGGGGEGVTFAQLPFPLLVTATDSMTGDSHELSAMRTPWLRVHEAVRASLSFPGVFREVALTVADGRSIRAWDGGNAGNCRVDIARRVHPDLPIVAVSLTYRGDVRITQTSRLGAWRRPQRLYDQAVNVLMRQFETVVCDGLSPQSVPPVVVLRPDLGTANTFGFALDRAQRRALIGNGRVAVRNGVQCLISTEPGAPASACC